MSKAKIGLIDIETSPLRAHTPNVSKFNTPQKFNKKIKDYCEYHKLEFEESKYNGLATFRINAKNTDEDECPF